MQWKRLKLMNNGKKKCSSEQNGKLKSCYSIQEKKYGTFENYFKDKVRDATYKNTVVRKCCCFSPENNDLPIDLKKCFACLYPFFQCPENRVQIAETLGLVFQRSSTNTDTNESQDADCIADTLFNVEDLLRFPKVNEPLASYSSFEQFTSKDETKNISVWAASCLSYLVSESSARVATELPIPIPGNPRDGRLDVCLITDEQLFIAEAKISFTEMMREGRYLMQIINYRNSIKEIIKNQKLELRIFLLIGGNETDLLYPEHPDCTANVGNLAESFYNNCVDNKLFFISAAALLSLAVKKLCFGEKYSIDKLSNRLFSENNVGLLSSGIVTKDREIIKFEVG